MKFNIVRIAAEKSKTTVGFDHDKDHDLDGQNVILDNDDLINDISSAFWAD